MPAAQAVPPADQLFAKAVSPPHIPAVVELFRDL
jgi:hypothetical protein